MPTTTKYSKKAMKKALNGEFEQKTLKFSYDGKSIEIKYKPEVSNVDTADIAEACHFLPYQTTFVDILGLKDPNTSEMFLFQPKPHVTWCKVLPLSISLSEQVEYELIVNDKRELAWEVLEEDQRKEIDEDFYKIDVDRNGSISAEECASYFKQLEKDNLANADQYYTKQIEEADDEFVKQDLKNKLTRFKEQTLNMIDNQIDIFFQSADINSDGLVSLKEWQLVKANQRVSLDKNYEKRIQELLKRQEEKRAQGEK